ncbi:hypothetical protein [Methylobacterium dankookense]|uniref:Hypervirulence associated protein TUDOR domain-containing protein n=1 Tax=Methylobacterium dankookense TaxID=560405 RepID=A0A564FRH7_9HYPH|nr:hypothetical protein [Methylobacterium dankookense]GJD57960.1 hypothetical protein IFDJLNFL_3874 [Methylobacterium dankookense]VUF10418.1 hypothetical protein MTDSW087_00085 [Methylobacterium dankookense]
MSHKFKIGQRVRLVNVVHADSRSALSDFFEVIRLMPEDRSGEPSYRVRSATGERAMREGELILAS